MTKATTLPEFGGHEVTKAAVKIAGTGTGLNGSLEFDPIALNIGDRVFFVMEGVCAGVEHSKDKKSENYVRTHKVSTEQISPIDGELASKILTEYAEEIKRRKDELAGQMRFDEEQAATEREAADSTDTPAEVAEKAKLRIADPFQPPVGE
jgi:hypothetical protein